jgi:predicted ATPase
MITNIHIKNFKAISNSSFPLGKITLFAGLNAVGKSSVIQAFLLLRQSYFYGSTSFDKGLILKDKDYVSLGFGKDVLAMNAEEDALISLELEIDFEHLLSLAFKAPAEKDVLPLANSSITKDDWWKLESVFSSDFQYLSANRINPQTQYLVSPHHVDDYDDFSLGKEGEYTIHFLAKHKDKRLKNIELKHPNAKSDNLLDNVSAWLSDISPGVKVNTTYYPELESASLSYQFEISSGYTSQFKPTNVGFGLTYALPIITALLSLSKGGMLIVENPESHLHPSGQSKIAQLCALASEEADLQIILESHSDHIFNGLRVSVKKGPISHELINTYFLYRDKNSASHETQLKPIYINEEGKADEWPAGFFDEWDKQLDKLLT